MLLDERLILNEDDGEIEITADDFASTEPAVSNTSTDWKKELEQAGTDQNAQATIWNSFFRQTFGLDYVESIANLGKAIRIECLVLGFKKELNPFIEFIQLLISKNVLLKNSNIKSTQYDIIHNSYEGQSYSDGYISSADLRGDGKLGDTNLIFNKALYTLSPSDIKSYLFLQKQVLKNIKDGDTTLKIRQNGEEKNPDAITYLKETFFNGESLKPLEDIKVKLGKEGVYSGNKGEAIVYKDASPEVIQQLTNQLLGSGCSPVTIILFLISKFGARAEQQGFNRKEAFKTISGNINNSLDIAKTAEQLTYLDKKLFSNNAQMSAPVLNALIQEISKKIK